MSVRAIARELGVAQSSVSVWVRGVPVPPPPRPPDLEPAPLDSAQKFCGRCQRSRSLSHFNRAGDGHQDWCRDCFRQYFKDRGALHRAQSQRAKQKRLEAAQAFVREHLSRHACVDCGEDEIAVLEFDHIGDKTAGVARLMNDGTLGRLKEEIGRCEVVCGNCHRRRTAARGGWARATGVYKPHWPRPYVRNLEHVVEVLRLAGCIDCGESDPAVLDFDHVGEKRSNVSKLIALASMERLKAEIAQCEVRCCNCHRLVTYARRGGTWRDAPDWTVAASFPPVPLWCNGNTADF